MPRRSQGSQSDGLSSAPLSILHVFVSGRHPRSMAQTEYAAKDEGEAAEINTRQGWTCLLQP